MPQTGSSWAIVTGASSGLGTAFATDLARRRHNLVLVARREQRMRDLAAQLERDHGITVVVEVLDLGAPDSATTLQQRLDAQGIEVDVLVNNAAFGLSGAFIDQEPERLRAMLQLDIVALTELTHVLGRRMARRGKGRILLVSSLAAYQPTPLLAAYGAAKAYVLSLGEALNVELAPGVGVTVLSPGLMDTEFNDVSGYTMKPSMRRTVLPTARVAEIGLDAMFARRSSVVAGRLNSLMVFVSRFLSRSFQARTLYKMSRT
jgi:short-subunit dehydrogenase